MSQTLTLTRGLPASGKTTWAKEQVKARSNVVRISRDDIRTMLYGRPYKHTKAREAAVTEVRNDAISAALGLGRSVIVDETGLHPEVQDTMAYMAEEWAASFHVQDFTNVHWIECMRRDAERCGDERVGAAVIKRMYRKYLAEPYSNDPDLPSVVICDLDGTLAHMQGRSPYDMSRVGEDTVDLKVREHVTLESGANGLILMSGRSADAKAATIDWLDRHDIAYTALYMRSIGDNRPDYIVKRELFDVHVRDRYHVELVLDDRQSVVDMWRNELGLTVWQVAEGDF